ncbi:hypothetical protein KAU43_01330 [candidate division WOR-3 bacterium]|nr:hypothetical protein [candidate division WOR-3 bacterium]
MKRKLPLLIVMILGIGMIIQYFVPHPFSMEIYRIVLDWMIIIGAFYLVLGIGGVLIINYHKIKRRKENWWLSIITIVALFFVALVGIFNGVTSETLFMKIFLNIQLPMQAAIFSLLAFYITSAAFRSFRAKTAESTVLLIVAIIIMIGNIPLSRYVPGSSMFSEWILSVLNLAGQRGILLGVGLGMAATSIKIILGIERSYLGGGE